METSDRIYMVETKARNEMPTIEAQEKAMAALKYCEYASEFTAANCGKPWVFALVPQDEVSKDKSLEGMVVHNTIN